MPEIGGTLSIEKMAGRIGGPREFIVKFIDPPIPEVHVVAQEVSLSEDASHILFSLDRRYVALFRAETVFSVTPSGREPVEWIKS